MSNRPLVVSCPQDPIFMDWCEGVRFAYLLQCLLGFPNLLCKTVDKSLLFVWFLQATFLIGELCYPVVDHMFRWNFPRYLFFFNYFRIWAGCLCGSQVLGATSKAPIQLASLLPILLRSQCFLLCSKLFGLDRGRACPNSCHTHAYISTSTSSYVKCNQCQLLFFRLQM